MLALNGADIATKKASRLKTRPRSPGRTRRRRKRALRALDPATACSGYRLPRRERCFGDIQFPAAAKADSRSAGRCALRTIPCIDPSTAARRGDGEKETPKTMPWFVRFMRRNQAIHCRLSGPLPPSCNGLLMSGTGQIASKLRSYLLSCLLKAIGDGDGQHCHRCNNKKQPKAYDQPKAV
jgi:hypothetical protein